MRRRPDGEACDCDCAMAPEFKAVLWYLALLIAVSLLVENIFPIVAEAIRCQ